MRKRNLKQLRLTHISAVTSPCQEGAKALCIKSAPDDKPNDEDDPFEERKDEIEECAKHVAKYVSENDGAHTFAEVLRENNFSEKIWPCVDAFTQSIRSIVGDTALTGGERDAKISISVDQFLSATRAISPDVSKQLGELLAKKEGPMPKTVEELQAELNKANADLAAANQRADTEKSRADTAEAALATEKTAHGETKKALTEATDETITFGGETIKLSEAGPGSFKVTKALFNAETTSRLEKRAQEEFPHVAGTPTEKALVLKTVDALPEDNETRKAVLAVMTAAEKMAKMGFERFGHRDGPSETAKSAQDKFNAKVDELVEGGMKKSTAMSKVRRDNPELVSEMNG